ncbi:carbamoyltransferase C-terminal domain-containing protein [[Flexibacter] sp. ATCC 35208]|uniref:carbamoyltransferase family protein n=1 Tax=[Flexibacter] sp. ATCC 35208 TaxID=1936242 RepID=UPI0009C322E7|nr:carbamoyltransferase C-terminal domain-containing protein [[Flexibacter] sp. ATCC 35208]AQX14464.1 carbomyltransferase [[Flexibacter] sp. ATCC 35208]OMP77246.1 hypothetical protein BW716_20720 [[Flexibacter] sp. ATCC 35208]
MKKRNYVGIASTCHDPAIAIINSAGDLVFAEATERYLQNKRAWNCVPDDLIRSKQLVREYCEPDAELVIATSWDRKYIKRISNPLWQWMMNRRLKGNEGQVIKTMRHGMIANGDLAGKNMGINFFRQFSNPNIIEKTYSHHLTHAAFACYSSPFEEAVCAVADGFGESGSTAFYHYRNGILTPIPGIPSSAGSLGMLYGFVCNACGFNHLEGEEWKVMGLAPYGKFNQAVYDLLRTFLAVKDCRLIPLRRAFEVTPALKVLAKDWPGDDSLKYADMAFTGQFFFSEILSELLENLYKLGISENLVLTGGCALNSAYNGKVQELTSFKNLHVPCAPADDGNAVGAALLAFYEDHSGKEVAGVRSPYLGSRMSSDAIERLRRFNKFNGATVSEDICVTTAKLIASGKIIGWVQGRAEYGPRSLGNRSILADPRNENIKDIINSRVKFREEFRPFAPSILHEHGHEYFENYSESLYMEKALRFKQENVHKVPGVVHVDGTGRLQTVRKEYNERFYNLISAFNDITGVPIILNTSFNIMGKPIVHSVEDAVAMFCTTGIDALVINDDLIML